MSKFKPGDTVEIVDYGWVYSSYEEMARLLKLTGYSTNNFPSSSNKNIFTVIGSKKHTSDKSGTFVVGISNADGEFLIGEGGIKKLPEWDL